MLHFLPHARKKMPELWLAISLSVSQTVIYWITNKRMHSRRVRVKNEHLKRANFNLSTWWAVMRHWLLLQQRLCMCVNFLIKLTGSWFLISCSYNANGACSFNQGCQSRPGLHQSLSSLASGLRERAFAMPLLGWCCRGESHTQIQGQKIRNRRNGWAD
jgi:hypothetical protein